MIGQPDFISKDVRLGPAGLNGPQGIKFSKYNLWVADTGNNRVLEFSPTCTSSIAVSIFSICTDPQAFTDGERADVVIGQPDFESNKGGLTSASSLHWPTSVAFDSDGNLWVSDMGNERVLRYPYVAQYCKGYSNDECLYYLNELLNVYGDLRLDLLPLPNINGEAADGVIGQRDFKSAITFPISASTLHQPKQITFDSAGNLWVADTSNNRVLGYVP